MAASEARHRAIAYLALAVGVVCIGFSAIFVKWAAVPGPSSAFYRMAFAGMVLVPWWLMKGAPRPGAGALSLIVAGGALLAVDLALWNTGLLLTSAATATLLANNAPIFVGLGAMVFFREHLGGLFWIGLALALTGIAWLAGGEAWRELAFNAGDMMALGASVCYAGYMLTTQRARARVDTVTFMAISVMTSIVVLLAVSLATGAPLAGFSARSWGSLLALGLISHLGGWLAINWALGHLRASLVSPILLLQPVLTALLAVPLLGEVLSLRQVLAGSVVLAGILVVHRAQRPGVVPCGTEGAVEDPESRLPLLPTVESESACSTVRGGLTDEEVGILDRMRALHEEAMAVKGELESAREPERAALEKRLAELRAARQRLDVQREEARHRKMVLLGYEQP